MFKLILLERTTLLKGWILSFFVTFPFTFLPILFDDGSFWINAWERIPMSLLYTSIFATAVCMAAVYHNYERQSIKIKYFNKPAFKTLNADFIPAGKGSLMEDLGFYLYFHNNGFNYYMDLEIELDDHSKQKLLIVPIVYAQNGFSTEATMKKYADLLRRDYKVEAAKHQLRIYLKPEEINAEDPLGMTRHLNMIRSKLQLQLV